MDKYGGVNVLFGRRLKRLRESMKIPQKEMAEMLGIPVYLLNRYENGNRGSLPRMSILRMIAQFFEVSIDWLLSPEDDSDKPLPVSEEHLQKIKAKAHQVLALRIADVPEDAIPEAIEEIERVIGLFKKWAKKAKK